MLEDLNLSQLRKIIRYYNLHTTIKGERGSPLSKLPKEELIKHILSKMTHRDGELVINPNLNKINISELTIKQPRKPKQPSIEHKINEIEEKLTKTKNSKEISKLLNEKFKLEDELEDKLRKK